MQLHELEAHIDGLLGRKDDRTLKNVLSQHSPEYIAQVINRLENGKRKIFALLPPEVQAEVVLRLTDLGKTFILPRISDHAIARLLHFNEEDDAADILLLLPEKRRPGILAHIKPDKRAKIEKLLTFGPETAGGLMDLNFIQVEADATMHAVMHAVQDYVKKHKQVPVALIHTSDGTRWVRARAIVSSGGHGAASRLSLPILAIPHLTDREKVLDMMEKEGNDVACVTDDHQKILGVIHMNDLLRVAEAEASEDVYRMGAVGPIDTNYLDSKFSLIWRKRVGWLSVLFVAELFTFTALSAYESSIAAVTALALFVPLCISTGGNSGSQAATLITRAMALGDITPRDWWRVLRRELLMGLALGLTLGAIGFLRATLTPAGIIGGVDRWMLALVIGQSVAAICLWGTLVGSMLPLVFKRLGFDPGYASSPFVATLVDVTGIVIYFSIANALILG